MNETLTPIVRLNLLNDEFTHHIKLLKVKI